MKIRSVSVTLVLAAFVSAGFSGCSTTPKTEAAAADNEAYVVVEPGVGSRIKKRVKVSELHKLKEPGRVVAGSEEDMQHIMPASTTARPGEGG